MEHDIADYAPISSVEKNEDQKIRLKESADDFKNIMKLHFQATISYVESIKQYFNNTLYRCIAINLKSYIPFSRNEPPVILVAKRIYLSKL